MKYAYILTVQRPGPNGSGFMLTDLSGVRDFPAGASRLDVYEQIMAQTADLFEVDRGALNTLFFSLEPDAL